MLTNTKPLDKADPSIKREHKPKYSQSEVIQNYVKGMKGVVKKLENSLAECHVEQRHLMIKMHVDDIKSHNLTSQLEEARKDNKHLLNILQQKCHESDAPQSSDVSPVYSTMSVVSLQYKYEELLAKYEGLLKLMTMRDKDIQKCLKENENIEADLDIIRKKLHGCEESLKTVCDKYVSLKQRRDNKINELKTENDILRAAHNEAVVLLHQVCMKNENIHFLGRADRALQETVQRSNQLQHENIQLKREISELKAKCGNVAPEQDRKN